MTTKRKFNHITLCLVFLANAIASFAQEIPVVISGATIHVGDGTVINGGTIVLNRGKILEIGEAPISFIKNAHVVDARGKHIYPGIIAMGSWMGLSEIDAVRATNDFVEVGEMNPNARTLIAFNTDSKILPTAFFNGIVYTQAVPFGGIISGSSSVLRTKAWNWEDAVVKEDEGIHLHWPENWSAIQQEGQESPAERSEKTVTKIREFLEDAKQYAALAEPKPFNARLNAMKKLFSGEQKLYVHARHAQAIVSALQFFKKSYPQVQIVLMEADQSWMVKELIHEANVPVVLCNVHALPFTAAEDVDQPYKTAAILEKEGVLVAIGRMGSWEARNLMFFAGTAAAYGLGKEKALMCITLNAAKILGVQQQIGSFEKGKSASILITTGDLLDMKESKVESIYLDGELQEVNGNQQALYEKYMQKYGLK